MVLASRKTVNKNIKILEAIGFDLERDEHHRYFFRGTEKNEIRPDNNDKKVIYTALNACGTQKATLDKVVWKINDTERKLRLPNFTMAKLISLIHQHKNSNDKGRIIYLQEAIQNRTII